MGTSSYFLLPPEPPWASLEPLGPSWGLRKPWELSEAFCSLGSSVRLRGLASFASSYPLLPLAPSCSPLVPEPPWAPGTFLGPQEVLGAFRSLWQPLVFSQTQGPCFPCSPSSPSLTLTPSCSPSPPEPPSTSLDPGTFLGPQEALGAFRSLWQPWVFSQTQGPCFPCSPSPPAPSYSLSLPLAP